ncbi:MAG: helix-turn-helix domain-containing protein, partial [Betaproteobacteria bacterium]|nr:helix-turn-helix domain-containing protein [Betaproteobacteria bacterium]
MNCAERLVALFGSQAEVARRLRLDRAVVNYWVKSGYVAARWAMEIEHVTGGQISAAEILSEANARKPVRLKSRPDGEIFFGSTLSGSDTMDRYAPARRISSFHPPQRTLMGPGPTEIHPRVLTTMSQP